MLTDARPAGPLAVLGGADRRLWVVAAVAVLAGGYLLAGLAVAFPESVYAVAVSVVVVALAAHVAARLEWNRGSFFVELILAALAFRLIMGFAHLAVGLWFFGGAVDFVGYNSSANLLGNKLLSGDFSGGGLWGGTSGWLFSYVLGALYILGGPSILAKFVVSTLIGFAGSYLFYRAFRGHFPDATNEQRFVMVAIFFLPSLAFWTSLLGKESWMMLGLGATALGFSRALSHASLRNVGMLVFGILCTVAVRPPVGAILIAACGAGLVVAGPRRGPAAYLRPVILTIIVGAVAMGMNRLAEFALRDKFDVDEVEAAKGLIAALHYQHVGLATDVTASGSSIGVQLAEPTLAALLRYLPFGVFTFLFRPLLVEVHNPMALLAAVEGTVFMGLIAWRLRRILRGARAAFTDPFFTFTVVSFALLTVVLCVESNLGAIVRHRSMVQPFLLFLLATPLVAGGGTRTTHA